MDDKKEFLDYIKSFNEGYDLELIGRAYDVAAKMHEGQFRKSGEPYLSGRNSKDTCEIGHG